MAEVRPATTSGSSTNRIRVFNPINPKLKKPWTPRQAAARKDQAERFVRDVLEDDERAAEIAVLSPEEYAEERDKEIAPNPKRRSTAMKRKTSPEPQVRENPVEKALKATTRLAEEQSDLYQRIRELEKENESLQDKLDEIADIIECDDRDCDADDHLEAIEEVVKGSRRHGTRHGNHAGED